MIARPLFLLAFIVQNAMAEEYTRCGVQQPSTDLYTQRVPQGHFAPKRQSDIILEINTYVHFITEINETDSISRLPAQMILLNSAYAPHNVHFNHINTSHTVNAAWANNPGSDSEDFAARATLRKGNYADLNIFYHTSIAPRLLGYATFPTILDHSTPSNDTRFLADGVFVDVNSLPNPNTTAYYNLGGTTVHEVGHWLGLDHVFDHRFYELDPCDDPDGDFVSDTPRQANSTRGCPVGKDSCPGEGDFAGLDAIHNWMDYSDDICYEEFTTGQRARWEWMWQLCRAAWKV